MREKPPFKLGYRPALDGLRAFAILAVLLDHTRPLIGHELVKGGNLGVDLFFVLSGFLITTLLVEEHRLNGRIAFGRFYGRRALRLTPALVALLIAVAVLAPKILPKEDADDTVRSIPIAAFYLTDIAIGWFGRLGLGTLRQTWSLGIEEKFYILWPALLGVGLRLVDARARSRRDVVAFCLLIACLVAGWRASLWFSGAPEWRLYYSFDTRADSLLVGCAAGLAISWGMVEAFSRWVELAVVAGLIVLLVATRFDSPFLNAGGFTLVALGAAVVTVNVVLAPGPVSIFLLENRVAVWIGRVSYSLYLWHSLVFDAVGHLDLPWPARLGGGFAIAFACAAASHYFIEAPVLRLKRRFAITKRTS